MTIKTPWHLFIKFSFIFLRIQILSTKRAHLDHLLESWWNCHVLNPFLCLRSRFWGIPHEHFMHACNFISSVCLLLTFCSCYPQTNFPLATWLSVCQMLTELDLFTVKLSRVHPRDYRPLNAIAYRPVWWPMRMKCIRIFLIPVCAN